MKLKDLILIALVCANVSLATLALVVYAGKSEPSAVAATECRAGDYIMVSGPITSSREALLVIDVVAKRANLYVPKPGVGVAGNQWDLASSRNLAADFGTAAARP
jgi:hypothetical protein